MATGGDGVVRADSGIHIICTGMYFHLKKYSTISILIRKI